MVGNRAKGWQFVHRHYANGRCDSICLRCFATAVSSRSQAEVAKLETLHVCDERKLCDLAHPVSLSFAIMAQQRVRA